MIKQNLTLGTTTSKKKKNNGTGGLYGDFIGGTGSANNVSLPNLPSSNPTYGDFINIPTPSKDKTGGAYTGNDLTLNPSTPSFGYGDALGDLSVTPKKKDEQIVTPTWGTGNNSKLPPSAPSGISKGDISVAPVDKSQFFDSNVVGTVGGGFSGGKKGGITNEGEIIGKPSGVEKMPTIKPSGSSSANKGQVDNADNFAPAIREIIENLYPEKKQPDAKYSDYTPAQSSTETTAPPQAEQPKQNETVDKETPAAPTEDNNAEDGKMSYEDYIAEMKKGYQEQLDAANKQAEQTKARAMADAENAYAQNKATYGTNAETLAQMGLTGGGYSDYLQAQAYAQKRADAQAATAQEIASKSNNRATYQQYITAMNEKLAEKALYEEQLEEQRKYNEQQTAEQREYERQQLEEQRKYNEEQTASNKKQNIFDSLWAGVQDTSTTYTEEAIDGIAKEYGLSDDQVNSLKTLLKNTKNKAAEEKSKAILENALANVDAAATGSLDEYLDGLQKLGLSDEDRATYEKTIREQMGNNTVDTINDSISKGDITSLDYNIATAEDYYAKGYISKEQLQTVYNKYATVTVETVANTDFGSDDQKKIKSYLSAQKDIEQWYKDGKLTYAMYKTLKEKAGGENYNACSGGWNLQGLGSGRDNDDVDITIGATSRSGNGKKEYDLLCGSTVTDSEIIAELNRIATGDANKTPSNTGCGNLWNWWNTNSGESGNAGRLIVAYGNMYLYTSKGWTKLKSDNNDAELANAISAFTGGGTRVGAKYSTDNSTASEIESRAAAGTLTYNDVAKYNAGIRTAHEFNRNNNSDKQKYGTYQAYLKAMYEKYKK